MRSFSRLARLPSLVGASAGALLAACSSSSATSNGGSDSGTNADTGSHHDGSTASDAKTGADGGRDGGGSDAAHDTGSPADSGSDASPADASHEVDANEDVGVDAATHGCTYTGKARGTTDVIATGSSGTLADFDLDCMALFTATGSGGIQSCPSSGCGATPTTVSVDGTYGTGPTSLRISTTGLLVLSPLGTPVSEGPDAAMPELQVYSLARNGSGSSVLASVPFHALGATGSTFFGSPGYASFLLFENDGSGDSTSNLELVVASADGGAGSLQSFSGNCSGQHGSAPCHAFVSSSGKVEYHVGGFPGIGTGSVITQTDLTSAGGAGVSFVSGRTEYPTSLVASDTFVAWIEKSTAADAGPTLAYACPPTAPCTPTAFTGLGAYVPVWASADTLFVTNANNDLATCPESDVLAGTCTPNVLRTALPVFSRIQVDASNVYVLASDGTQLLRIAR